MPWGKKTASVQYFPLNCLGIESRLLQNYHVVSTFNKVRLIEVNLIVFTPDVWTSKQNVIFYKVGIFYDEIYFTCFIHKFQ
jgi:hypothetical protein